MKLENMRIDLPSQVSAARAFLHLARHLSVTSTQRSWSPLRCVTVCNDAICRRRLHAHLYHPTIGEIGVSFQYSISAERVTFRDTNFVMEETQSEHRSGWCDTGQSVLCIVVLEIVCVLNHHVARVCVTHGVSMSKVRCTQHRRVSPTSASASSSD